MTQNRWQLDGLAFTVALEAFGRDRLPYPLAFRPDFCERAEDFERLRRRAAERVQQVLDRPFYDALAVLLEPKLRVEVHGFYGPRQSQVVRMHAGIVDNVATLALQQPGPTREHGRDIVITRHPASRLAADLIVRLPAAEPGTHPAFQGRREDLRASVYSRHPTRLSPQEQLQRFFRRPRTGTGEITVYPGYTIDSRPTADGRAFIWLDYPDDGRYLLHHHSQGFTVTPATPDELLRQLQGRINATARHLSPAR